MRKRGLGTGGGLCLLAATAVGALLAGMSAEPAWIARSAGPRVGDVIVFGRPQPVAMIPNVRLLVHRPHEFGCVLDLAVLGQGPGSLIVEEAAPHATRSVRLHWAGRRTSSDAADCGESADLILDQAEMQLLARLGQP